MQINLVRTPEDLIEVVLVADGWGFCGISLYSRADRFRNAPCRKADALIETLDRHQYDNSGQTMLDFYGPNPSEDQLLDIVGELNLILDCQDQLKRATEALHAIQNLANHRDGRVQEVFDVINVAVVDVMDSFRLNDERREMRTNFIAI